MIRKITYITFHNWDAKRQGGFHKFAEYTALQGIETLFFSFSRPYYIYFKKEERLNRNILKTLCKGKLYPVGQNKLYNFSWPTLALPNPLFKLFPDKVQWCLHKHSLTPFKKIAGKMAGTDCFVFESCEGIVLLDIIKKYFPKAKIVYRPSDPLMIEGCSFEKKRLEIKMLEVADMNFIVNQEGLDIYKKNIPNFEAQCKYMILPNGVNYNAFTKKYAVPNSLQKKNTALYVGARDVEWPLIIESAKSLPNINFIIICPESIPKLYHNKINDLLNIDYIPGISPTEVPAYVTNCDVIIVPNPDNRYKKKPWGITAKYYQAMAAGKPIVAYHDTIHLRNLGIPVTYTHDDFIQVLKETMNKDNVSYSIDLKENSWSRICDKFLSTIQNL
jgi:glycosyltransferase involved in cell wall biosynthesis